jgi:hypothetical protein
MKKLARKYVFWNGLSRDIENFVRNCEKWILSIISDGGGGHQRSMDYRKSWEEMLENQRNFLTAKDSMASAKHSADLQKGRMIL